MLYEWVSVDVGNLIHDNAGWWMMFPAMLMIWGEMALLSALLIETSMEGPLSFGERGGAPGTPGRGTRYPGSGSGQRSPLVGPGLLGPRGHPVPRVNKPRSSPRE